MCKKILSVFCIGIIFISILNPLKIKAYDLGYTNTPSYENGVISKEDAEETLGLALLSGILQNGGELVVPQDSSLSTNDIYDLVVGNLADFAVNHIEDAVKYIQWYANDRYLDIDDSEGYYRFVWKSKEEEQQKLLSDLMTFAISGADYFNQEYPNLYEDDSIDTNPDVNYLPYIELINGKSFNYQYQLTDNWLTTLDNNPNDYTLVRSYSSVSYKARNANPISNWDKPANYYKYVSYFDSNYQLYCYNSYFYEPISIYINNVNNVYQITTSTFVPTYIATYNGNSPNKYLYGGYLSYDRANNIMYTSSGTFNSQSSDSSYYASADSLEDALKLVAMQFRNVNIYVNGNPWSIVTNPPEPVSIGGQGYITDTQIPIRYDVPEGTYWNPNILKSILRQLLDIENNTNGVVKWVDIEEAFTDEYGVQALWTISVVRNNYDVLIQEQYPIGTIPSKDKGLRLPQEQISGYSDEMVYITKVAGSDMIPNDILTILGACGVIILIAYLINRMLE